MGSNSLQYLLFILGINSVHCSLILPGGTHECHPPSPVPGQVTVSGQVTFTELPRPKSGQE